MGETNEGAGATIPTRGSSGFRNCLIAAIVFVFIVGGIITAFRFFSFFMLGSHKDTGTPPVATKGVTPTPTISVSNEDLLSYFTSIGFHDSRNDSQKALSRWDQPSVSIQLIGNYNQAVIDQLNKFIQSFNSLSHTTKLSLASQNGDITVYFESREALAKKINDPSLLERPVYAWANVLDINNGKITAAQIEIQDDQKDEPTSLPFTLFHELGHTIGFHGHDHGKRGCNLMSDVPCAPLDYFTIYDQFAIKALYNTSIPTKISESAAVSYLNSHWPN